MRYVTMKSKKRHEYITDENYFDLNCCCTEAHSGIVPEMTVTACVYVESMFLLRFAFWLFSVCVPTTERIGACRNGNCKSLCVQKFMDVQFVRAIAKIPKRGIRQNSHQALERIAISNEEEKDRNKSICVCDNNLIELNPYGRR